VTGSIHAWFGGPGEASPARETASLGTPVFLHHPDRRIVGHCQKKASLRRRPEPAAHGVPARTGQKKERMKLNNLAKVMVLGLAVFVATGAFAFNKGTFQARETVEINGQQLPAGEYQVRWEGNGPSVEISFRKNNKEVAKTTAKAVQLKNTPSFDSSIVNHANGKAVVSEIEFAGKRTAFSLE
jgi:hypothetical protein